MKKTIIIFCTVITITALTAFGITNNNSFETSQIERVEEQDIAFHSQPIEKMNERSDPDFLYDVGTRFSPMLKNNLLNATSIYDFFNADEVEEMASLKSVNIIIIKNERQTAIRALGYSDQFTKSQLELLQTFDYSTSFSIRVDYEKMNIETGMMEGSFFNPHLTIVPEKQAEYKQGKEALIAYLKENSKDDIADVHENKLRPAKLHFTVTKIGTIENANIGNHSGYPAIDKRMIELISKAPGKWVPAENAKGDKVDQELVISYGLTGC